MDIYEKWGYTLLAIIAALYIVALFVGMIATFPFGLIGLLLIAGHGKGAEGAHEEQGRRLLFQGD